VLHNTYLALKQYTLYLSARISHILIFKYKRSCAGWKF